MSDPADFPYDTRLNVLYPPLEVVDTPAVIASVTHPWFNQTLCQVNDAVVRLGVMQGGVSLAQARRVGRVLLLRGGDVCD